MSLLSFILGLPAVVLLSLSSSITDKPAWSAASACLLLFSCLLAHKREYCTDIKMRACRRYPIFHIVHLYLQSFFEVVQGNFGFIFSNSTSAILLVVAAQVVQRYPVQSIKVNIFLSQPQFFPKHLLSLLQQLK